MILCSSDEMKSNLVRFPTSSVAAVSAIIGQEKVDQLQQLALGDESKSVFFFGCASKHAAAGTAKRKMVLFHGAGGVDAPSNPQVCTLLRQKNRFLDAASGKGAKTLRAFLSPHLQTALSFGTVTQLPAAASSSDDDFGISEAVKLSTHDDGNVTVLTVCVLELDFLSDASLPVFSETGPLLIDPKTDGGRKVISFPEDDQEPKHACLSYVDIDHEFQHFAVLRNVGDSQIRLRALGAIHHVRSK
jgi:hypothetical protein